MLDAREGGLSQSWDHASSCEDFGTLCERDRLIRQKWRQCAKARRERSGLRINTQLAASARSKELLEEQTPTQFDMSPQPCVEPQSAPLSSSRGPREDRGRRHLSDEPLAAAAREAHAAAVDLRREAMTYALESLARDRAGSASSAGRSAEARDDDEEELRAVLGAPGLAEAGTLFYSPKGVEEGEAAAEAAAAPMARPLSAHDAEKMVHHFSARVQARSLDLCAATAPPEFHQDRPRARANSAAQSLRSWWAFGSCCSSDDPGER